MKFYEKLDAPNANNSNSIILKDKKYIHKTSGEPIGRMVVTQEELMKLYSHDYSKELKARFKDFDNIYFETHGNRGYDKFETDMYEVEVYRNHNINMLPYGVFNMNVDHSYGIHLVDFNSQIDPGLIVPNQPLVQMIKDFYANEVATGRKNKKGFLLYGEPGNGKTTDIMSLFSLAKELEMRIFIVGRKVDLSDLNDFKSLLEKDKTLFILEEITQRTDSEGTEELLTFLDGENSWNNSVTIATTNYAKNLPPNLVDRPGRFDTFIEYTNPTSANIIELGIKFGFKEEDVECLLGKSLSYDYVSFILSRAKVLETSVKDALDIEKKKKKKISETFKDDDKMGI